jgi:hypothetical protein
MGVIALNEAGELYAALAEGIRGTAVGWSPTAVARLERELLQRYGPILGGERAVAELVVLATTPVAA